MLVGGREPVVSAEPGLPTLVATAPVDAGTRVADLGPSVEIRILPAEARAEGAVGSIGSLPPGLLAGDLVVGQQVLVSSVVDDPVDQVGEGLVAVSARLDPERWVGPFTVSGPVVDVYAVGDDGPRLVAEDAVVLEAPEPGDLDTNEDSVVTLGVAVGDVEQVVGAVAGDGIWLVAS